MQQVAGNFRSILEDGVTPVGATDQRERKATLPAQDAYGTSPGEQFRPTQQPHALLFQFALVNLAAFALLAAAYLQGWLTAVVEGDRTGLTIAILGVFAAGLAVCAYKLHFVTCELVCVRNFDPCRKSWASAYLAEVAARESGSRAIIAATLRLKLMDRIIIVRHVANSLVLLGLIGTVLGFIIALSGVDPAAAGDVQAIAPMVTDLIGGMSVALYTTLVGAVSNLWLTANYRILSSAAVRLATELVALGEANAR